MMCENHTTVQGLLRHILLNPDNFTFVFDARVQNDFTHLSIAAIANKSLAAAHSLCATPGTRSFRKAAADPTILSKILVLLFCIQRKGLKQALIWVVAHTGPCVLM